MKAVERKTLLPSSEAQMGETEIDIFLLLARVKTDMFNTISLIVGQILSSTLMKMWEVGGYRVVKTRGCAR